MKESSLRMPPGAYFIRKYDWALAATEGNEPAAELLAVFLYHYDNRTANRILVELVQRAITKRDGELKDLGDWMPYSNAYMRECLLGTHGQNQVVEAVRLLSDGIEWIDRDPPLEIREFYSKSHSWFRLKLNVIQDWIDNVWMADQKKASVYSPQDQEVKTAIENVTGTNLGELKIPKTPVKFADQIKIVCGFDKHIHGRNGNFTYDKERKQQIQNRLMENHSLGEFAQATIGLLYSDWHNARHPENTLGEMNSKGTKGKKYLDPEYIFKTNKRFETQMRNAEENGVTIEIAQNELAEFLDGKDSKFSPARFKQETSKPDAATDTLTPGERKRYKGFAFAIARFFATNVSNAEILEMCDSMTALKDQGKGLTDARVLNDCLIEAAKISKPILTPEIIAAIETFSQDFCETQELNQ